MWKGLGQKLKDIAEDLTTPLEEEGGYYDEEEEGHSLGQHRRHAQTQPPPPRTQSGDLDDDTGAHTDAGDWVNSAAGNSYGDADEDEDYIEAEGGILIPRSSLKKPPRAVEAGGGSGGGGVRGGSSPHTRANADPSPSPSPVARQGSIGQSLLQSARFHLLGDASTASHDADGHYYNRRLEDELNLATPGGAGTHGNGGGPPTATVAGGGGASLSATLQGTPMPSVGQAPGQPVTHPLEAEVVALRARASRAEADKARLGADVERYQAQVKQSHEDTVRFYEGQIDALKAALTKKDEALAKLADDGDSTRGNADPEVSAEVKQELTYHRAHHERLAREIELLRAEAIDRDAAHRAETLRLTKALSQAEQQQEHQEERQEQEPPSSQATKLESHVVQLQGEVAQLRESLEQARTALHEKEAAPSPPSPAKDAEIASLTAKLAATRASLKDVESQLGQMSEGYLRLDALIEQERAAHDRTSTDQLLEVELSAEKVSRVTGRLTELERLLQVKDEELRDLSSISFTPQKEAAVDDAGNNKEEVEVAQQHVQSQQHQQQLQEQEEEIACLRSAVAGLEQAYGAARAEAAAGAAREAELLAEAESCRQRARDSERALAAAGEQHSAEVAAIDGRHRVGLAEMEERLRGELEAAVARAEAALLPPVAAVVHDDGAALRAAAAEEKAASLTAERAELERRLDDLVAVHAHNVAASTTLEAMNGELTEDIAAAHGDRAALAVKLSQSEAALAALQEDRRADRSRAESGDLSAAALSRRVAELEDERDRTADVIAALQRGIVDCMTRNNHKSLHRGNDATDNGNGSSAGAGLELFDVPASRGYSFPDWVNAMTAALEKTASLSRKAARVQGEWERTYEEARKVNETLNQQVTDAWKGIGQLQEEASLRDETIRQLTDHVRSGDERFVTAQEQLIALTNEVDGLRENVSSGVSGGGGDVDPNGNNGGGGPFDSSEALLHAQAESDRLRAALEGREDELATAMRGLENLHEVLEGFRAARGDEVAERTLDMQLEIEQLRSQVAEAAALRATFRRDLEGQQEQYEREAAGRNLELAALHRKLAELRKALETAARQLDGESTIDKGVVSHILANFIHGFVGQRRETGEVLKILSGLLGWDEDLQERVGLLPGPLNPQPPKGSPQRQRGGKRAALMSWVRGGTTSTDNGGGSQTAVRSASAARGSGDSTLASMWVDFLMHESEHRAASETAAAAAATTATATTMAPVRLDTVAAPPLVAAPDEVKSPAVTVALSPEAVEVAAPPTLKDTPAL